MVKIASEGKNKGSVSYLSTSSRLGVVPYDEAAHEKGESAAVEKAEEKTPGHTMENHPRFLRHPGGFEAAAKDAGPANKK